jgi:hypothetical protein
MTKKKIKRVDKQDIEIELEKLIKQNEHMTTGIKKIIDSIENKNTNKK